MANSTTLHLHLGVHVDELDELRSAVRGNVIRIDGDGWYAWGKKPGEAGNDDTSRHVILETTSAQGAENLVTKAERAVALVAETWGESAEVFAVLTPADRWTAEIQSWAL